MPRNCCCSGRRRAQQKSFCFQHMFFWMKWILPVNSLKISVNVPFPNKQHVVNVNLVWFFVWYIAAFMMRWFCLYDKPHVHRQTYMLQCETASGATIVWSRRLADMQDLFTFARPSQRLWSCKLHRKKGRFYITWNCKFGSAKLYIREKKKRLTRNKPPLLVVEELHDQNSRCSPNVWMDGQAFRLRKGSKMLT